MEENVNKLQNPQEESHDSEAETQGTEQKEKLFTQEEVNGLIQGRISRMREKITQEVQEEQSQKVAELEARERNLMVREELHRREMPKELADLISCTDEADLKAKLDILQEYAGKTQAEAQKKTGVRRGFFPLAPDSEAPDPIRKAMGLA